MAMNDGLREKCTDVGTRKPEVVSECCQANDLVGQKLGMKQYAWTAKFFRFASDPRASRRRETVSASRRNDRRRSQQMVTK